MALADYIHQCSTPTNTFYYDNRFGTKLVESELHEIYHSRFSHTSADVVSVFRIMRVENMFHLIVQMPDGKPEQADVLYNDINHTFINRTHDPTILIPAIINNKEYTEFFTSHDHPYFDPNYIANYLNTRSNRRIVRRITRTPATDFYSDVLNNDSDITYDIEDTAKNMQDAWDYMDSNVGCDNGGVFDDNGTAFGDSPDEFNVPFDTSDDGSVDEPSDTSDRLDFDAYALSSLDDICDEKTYMTASEHTHMIRNRLLPLGNDQDDQDLPNLQMRIAHMRNAQMTPTPIEIVLVKNIPVLESRSDNLMNYKLNIDVDQILHNIVDGRIVGVAIRYSNGTVSEKLFIGMFKYKTAETLHNTIVPGKLPPPPKYVNTWHQQIMMQRHMHAMHMRHMEHTQAHIPQLSHSHQHHMERLHRQRARLHAINIQNERDDFKDIATTAAIGVSRMHSKRYLFEKNTDESAFNEELSQINITVQH